MHAQQCHKFQFCVFLDGLDFESMAFWIINVYEWLLAPEDVALEDVVVEGRRHLHCLSSMAFRVCEDLLCGFW
jgi:hypothetical protein